MKINQKIIVLSIGMLLIFSTSSLFVEARSNEKIKVLIGFNGEIQPDLIRSYGGKIDYEIGIANAIATSLPERAIQALENNPNIAYIELDQKVYILEDNLDWGVDRIDAEIVWGGFEDAKSVTGNAGAGVNVMILDTGIDYNHVELDDNYAGGTDIINGDNDPMDDHWHGTHCAGIVGAEDNEIGIIGVAPEINLYAVKVLDSSGGGTIGSVSAGIDWAVSNGADVISMSLGGGSGSITLENACNNAYSQGVVVVAAAGNSGNPPGRGDSVEYPARYSSVIAVASTDINDKRARSSSTGPDVEIAAPGVDIQSTYPDNYLATASGTSMACPHVAGVAALVIASGITNNEDVRTQLTSTAEDLGDAGRDTHYGYGLVDAEAAAGPKPDKHDVAITNINAPSSILVGDTANIDVTVANEGTYAETTTVTLTDTYDGIVIDSQDVSLSAGGSTIVTFTWDTAGEALGDHVLEATTSVVSGETETDDNSMTTTVNVYEQGQQTDMWVSDISWRVKIAGRNVFLYHTVTVMSGDGPVSSATVYSTLDGPGGPWHFSRTTDSNGQVEFGLKGANSGSTYTATVTDITHSSYTYNSALDVDNPSTYTV